MKRKRILILASGCFLAIVIVVALIFTGSIRHTITLSAAEIESNLRSKFPVDKSELIFKAHFNDPTVAIDQVSGQITLGLATKVTSLGYTVTTGKVEATGAVRYEPKSGEFFLDSPTVRVVDLTLVRLAERDKPKAEKLVERGLQEFFSKMPIYRLDDKDSKFVFARRVLKSMKVQNGKLEVELGF